MWQILIMDLNDLQNRKIYQKYKFWYSWTELAVQQGIKKDKSKLWGVGGIIVADIKT